MMINLRDSIMDTRPVVKDVLLEQLNDKMSYEEKKRLQKGLDLDFVRTKKSSLKRRERSSTIWLVGSLVYMAMVAIVWGVMSGWTNVFMTIVSAISVIGVVATGIVQYTELKKTIHALEHAEALLSREEENM